MTVLPPCLGQRPHTLDGAKEIVSRALAQCLAENVAEEVHVITQRFVRVQRHFPIIDMLLPVIGTDDAETLGGMRRLLLVILLTGMSGTAVELLLLDHF